MTTEFGDMPGVLLAGTSSRVGKTVAALVTARALESAGRRVQPAKAGPDFIDPSHHAAALGRPSRTLDPWLEGVEGMRRNYYRGAGDVCLVEGMMGLYDGTVSTARVAEDLGLPVVLVCDASAGMESVAATALGFRQYAAVAGRDIEVAGVLVQQCHGGRHEQGVRDALPEDLAYFGRIPPMGDLEIPDRHLGLHMGSEAPLDDDALDDAAAHVRTDRLLDLARSPPTPAEPAAAPPTADGDGDDPRIAVARDDAFCFLYPGTVERLRAGGEVVTFRPTAGEDLPDCDGVYLPGGYPELHGGALSASPALETIAARASEGLPVLGECGGLMALSESLTTAEGETHAMAGVLPADVTMHDRYQALDHVELAATGGTVTADAGASLRGHEFHYSGADVAPDARFAFSVTKGDGIDGEHDGLTEYDTLGTYAHVHAESGAFDTFLARCRR